MTWMQDQKLFRTFADYNKFGEAADSLDDGEALQIGLDKLENWAITNCMKLNKSVSSLVLSLVARRFTSDTDFLWCICGSKDPLKNHFKFISGCPMAEFSRINPFNDS